MSDESRSHAWTIAEREKARHVAARGRLHAFETLAPATTALIVVDMVPFFAATNAYVRGVIPHINRLAADLRDAGGVVVWALPSAAEPHPDLAAEFYGAGKAETYRTSGGDAGPLRNKLCLDLRPAEDDLFVEKQAASALHPIYSPLHPLLQARGVRTVIVTGTVTNVCCEATVRDARALGYRVIMVADANAAPTDAMHNATLHTVYRSFGDVRPTDEVLGLISAARPPPP